MDFRAIGMGVAFAFVWASAFTSARIIVADAPPLTALSIRFAISGAAGIGIAVWMGQGFRLTRLQWRAAAIFGICQNALYLGLNFVAMRTVEASLAAIVASTMPLLVAFAQWTAQSERMRTLGLAGLALGFAGVALIMGNRIVDGVDPFGLALCVGGVISLTAATLAAPSAAPGGGVMMVVGIQMLIGAAALAPVALATESWEVAWSPQMLSAFAYTTIFPGLVATWIWFLLVNRIGAVRAATFHFLAPPFGVAIAAALLGEALGPADVIGVATVAAGILAVQLSKRPAG